ncbi:MAG: helix-turn-helix domain-containing protein [Gaiellaceae bacterium]
MPGVGEALQRARHERRLTLEQAEQAIKVRARYLAALESERFDVLPGAAYVRAFTREYAAFLGLDPEPLLGRLEDDLSAGEPTPAMLMPQRSGGLLGRYWLGAAIVVVVAGVMAWSLTRNGGHPTAPAATPATTAIRTIPRKPPPARPRPLPPPRIALVASRGDCWLSVHVGSATGPTLYEATLVLGHSLRFARRTLWIRVGAPSSLDIRLNGRRLPLPPAGGGTTNLVVTRAGVRAA